MACFDEGRHYLFILHSIKISTMGKSIIKEFGLYYKEYGSGEPLLLIAGLASDSQSWLTVITKLSKYYKVIVFDNVGVGRSSQDNTGATITTMADDCAKLLEYLNIKSANICGHSMGGMIAMDLAIRYPEKVNKLILVATSPKLSARNISLFNDWSLYLQLGMKKELWFRNLFYWIFTPDFFNDSAIVNQTIKMSINYRYPQSNASFNNQVIAISSFNCENKLSLIKAKTLAIFGEFDLLFEYKNKSLITDNIPDCEYVIIPNAAHSIHVDNPDFFIKTLLNFL